MTRFNRIPKHFAVSIVSVLITFSLLEIYTRIFLHNETDTSILSEHLRSISIRLLIRPSTDPAIFFELKPNLDIKYFNSRVRTDPSGRRIPSNGQAPETVSGPRIAVIGDSTSFGWKVNYEESYPAIYKTLLESETNRRILLENYSVPGYNTEQEFEVLRTKIIQTHPDLLIIHYDHNDAEPTAYFQRADFLLPTYGDNFLHSAFIKYVIRRYRIHINQKRSGFDIKKHKNIRGYLVDGPLFDRHLEIFRKISDLVHRSGIPAIIVIYSAEVTYDPDYRTNEFYTRLCKRKRIFFSKLGFFVLDLYPRYQAYLKKTGEHDFRKWWVSSTEPMDSHPNFKGHRFIAEELFKFTMEHPELKHIFLRSGQQDSRFPD